MTLIPTVALIIAAGLAFGIGALADQEKPAEPVVATLGADGIQRASLTLDSYSYAPSRLIVEAGKPVELTLTSVTLLTPHNFVLKDAAAGLAVDQDVSAGKTVTVRFTPTQPGTFTFYCDKKLLFFASHREKGMEGTLEVR
jgi:heme/copper-type cytochrome/quinol oxidase subunit 2